jgi:hypothetical protein
MFDRWTGITFALLSYSTPSTISRGTTELGDIDSFQSHLGYQVRWGGPTNLQWNVGLDFDDWHRLYLCIATGQWLSGGALVVLFYFTVWPTKVANADRG